MASALKKGKEITTAPIGWQKVVPIRCKGPANEKDSNKGVCALVSL